MASINLPTKILKYDVTVKEDILHDFLFGENIGDIDTIYQIAKDSIESGGKFVIERFSHNEKVQTVELLDKFIERIKKARNI